MNRRSILRLLGMAPVAAAAGLTRPSGSVGLAAGETPAIGRGFLTPREVRALHEEVVGIDGGGLDDRSAPAAELPVADKGVSITNTPSRSLCDDCTDPGHCCRLFGITLWETTVDGAAALFKERDYPFQVHAVDGPWTDRESGRQYARFSCSCPMNVGGRCSIYEDRPQLCRDYEPASDPLCVFHSSRWVGRPDR